MSVNAEQSIVFTTLCANKELNRSGVIRDMLMAIWRRKPETTVMIDSNQGVQYTMVIGVSSLPIIIFITVWVVAVTAMTMQLQKVFCHYLREAH
ncbi:MAG: hypothetical protein ACJAUP_001991 [Cellvibrionaceae bacterium]|jgi:hypothetical protein